MECPVAEKRRRFFPEKFKRQAVERVRTSGLSVANVTMELGIHDTQLRRWLRQFLLEGASPCGALQHAGGGAVSSRPCYRECQAEAGTAKGPDRARHPKKAALISERPPDEFRIRR
ncbi:transposase [Jiella pelagia]|uniref:transposase n=1 Tax=Jiella pelagia TaxID=2986949 RepID=UPI0038B3D4A2